MTIIVADTTCGLPRELLKQRGIPLIPQIVIFGEQSFHDDKELDTATFLKKLKAAKELQKDYGKLNRYLQPASRPSIPVQPAA